MRIRLSPLPVLATVASAVVLFGCSTAPASQETEGTSAPQPPVTVAAVDGETTEEASVEIGYEVGLRAPGFAMSLLDGTEVTASSLSAEGRPVFLYFHATY